MEQIMGMEPETFHKVKWAGLIVLVILVVAGLLTWNSFRVKKYTPETLQKITQLLEFAAKSAEDAERVASEEPLQALYHAHYAICFVNAARFVVDNDDKLLKRLSGTDMDELQRYLRSLQTRLSASLE
jgi:predicted negative regulator of RcsB-dependent stress response